MSLNPAQTEAIAVADAHLGNAALPTYSQLVTASEYATAEIGRLRNAAALILRGYGVSFTDEALRTLLKDALAEAPEASAVVRKKSSVVIETSRYFRRHLDEPRGSAGSVESNSPRGRGPWLFEDILGNVLFQHNGNYGAARGAAQAWAVGTPHSILYVRP